MGAANHPIVLSTTSKEILSLPLALSPERVAKTVKAFCSWSTAVTSECPFVDRHISDTHRQKKMTHLICTTAGSSICGDLGGRAAVSNVGSANLQQNQETILPGHKRSKNVSQQNRNTGELPTKFTNELFAGFSGFKTREVEVAHRHWRQTCCSCFPINYVCLLEPPRLSFDIVMRRTNTCTSENALTKQITVVKKSRYVQQWVPSSICRQCEVCHTRTCQQNWPPFALLFDSQVFQLKQRTAKTCVPVNTRIRKVSSAHVCERHNCWPAASNKFPGSVAKRTRHTRAFWVHNFLTSGDTIIQERWSPLQMETDTHLHYFSRRIFASQFPHFLTKFTCTTRKVANPLT